MIIAEIKSDICEGYIFLSRYEPPLVMCWIKYDANTVPIGSSPPRNVAAIPLNPMLGTDDWVTDHCSYPVRNRNAAPHPANAPPMKRDRPLKISLPIRDADTSISHLPRM